MAYKNPPATLFEYNAKTSKISGGRSKDNDYKELGQVYFAFIDVLGFKNAFENKGKNDITAKFKKAFQYYNKLMQSSNFINSGTSDCYAGQTSDTLYFYTKRLDFLIEFIKVYLHFSMYAMSQDVFFRGGIAKGSLFCQLPHQFYGESIINSYKIESNIAKMPIVVVDQDTYKDIVEDYKEIEVFSAGQDRMYLKPFINQENLNLESILNLSIDELENIDKKRYMKIRDCIKANIKKFEFDDGNYQKYTFLRNQFEEFIKNGCIE